jgi:hypothetical protein
MSYDTRHHVRLGTILRNKTDRGRSTLGAFARGNGGEQYILTARDAFSDGPDVFEWSSGKLLGRLQQQDAMTTKLIPFWHAIGVVRLNEDITPSLSDLDYKIQGLAIVPMDRLLGIGVRTCHGSRERIGSVITSFGVVRLAVPNTSGAVTFSGIVEVKFAEVTPFDRGSAGELVVTSNGNPVGLIIAGNPERCFIAPLDPLVQAKGLHLQLRCPSRVDVLKALIEDDDAQREEEPDVGELSTKAA